MKNINEIIKKLLGLAIEDNLTHTRTRLHSTEGEYDVSVDIEVNRGFRPLSVMDNLGQLTPQLDTQKGIKE